MISTLILLLVSAPAFAAAPIAPEIDGTGTVIAITLLVGVLGLVKERSRRK